MAVKVRHHKGAWWVFIDHHGKRKAKCIGDNKRAAQQVAEKIQAKIALGQFEIVEEKETPVLFADYAKEWLKTTVGVRCKPSTVREYEVILTRHINPAFGAKEFAAITREDIKRSLVSWVEAGLSRARVHMILRLLSAICTSAMEDEKATANPAAKPGRLLPPQASPKEKIRALTREELARLLETLRQRWPEYFPSFLTLARTGMRLGEALGLQWGDIDWHGGFMEIRRGLRKGTLSSPKSKKSRRVDMSRQLQETLRVLLATREEQAWRNGWSALPEWVFCGEDRHPLCDVTLRRDVLRPALHQAELRQIRIHDLRHTFASLLIQQGESLVYVKEQLGHHSIKITVDTYGHLVPGGNRQAVDKLDDPQTHVLEATIRNPRATTPENLVLFDQLDA